MQKVNLCESCSKEKGVTDPTGFALADLLLGLGAAQEIEKSGTLQKCPACGFSQADFKKTGRLGCSLCYDTFSEGLNSLLKAMHKGTSHVGKVPARLMESIQFDATMKNLQKELDKAVVQENYESAADIRDQIKHLEKKSGGNS
ncbi:MAG: UvrB/UvrC motif-containing protein [Chthoniobacteraceae bacterium]